LETLAAALIFPLHFYISHSKVCQMSMFLPVCFGLEFFFFNHYFNFVTEIFDMLILNSLPHLLLNLMLLTDDPLALNERNLK
jgi:hypothetical protein